MALSIPNTSLKILKALREKKVRLMVFRDWYNLHNEFIRTENEEKLDRERFQRAIYKTLKKINPDLLDELSEWTNSGDGNIVLYPVKDKYQKRFLKYYHKKVKKHYGKIPKIKATDAIKLFLFRGFVHRDDFHLPQKNQYPIKSNIGELVWPEYFDTHSEALVKMQEVGVEGYTSCPTKNILYADSNQKRKS